VEEETKNKQFRGFFSNYQHSLDDKGRVFIPKKYREALASIFMLTTGLDYCLIAYPMDEWEKFIDELDSIPYTDTDGRYFVRNFMSNAVECEMDKQGRIVIQQEQRNYAGLEKDVSIVGVGNHFEIWDSNRWKTNRDNYFGNLDALAEKMQKYLVRGDAR